MQREWNPKLLGAGVLAVLVLAALALQFVFSGRALERQGVERIEHWLRYEPYRASVGKTIDVLSGQWTERPVSEEDRPGPKIPFEILSVDRRGWKENFVVRVKLRYPAGAPPGKPEVRYFRMRYSPLTNSWKVVAETNSFSYWLALLP